MTYKTINLHPETYSMLTFYKHAGMTFDDVVKDLMKLTPEKRFYKIILDQHRKEMEKIRASEYAKSQDLDEALEKI